MVEMFWDSWRMYTVSSVWSPAGGLSLKRCDTNGSAENGAIRSSGSHTILIFVAMNKGFKSKSSVIFFYSYLYSSEYFEYQHNLASSIIIIALLRWNRFVYHPISNALLVFLSIFAIRNKRSINDKSMFNYILCKWNQY